MNSRARHPRDLESELKVAQSLIQEKNDTIARQKRALVELRAEYDRYRTAFEQAAVGIIRTGLNGRILDVNDHFCWMLGYSRRELTELAIVDITHQDEHVKDQSIAELALQGREKTFDLTRRYLHKGGRVIWATSAVSLVRDDMDRPNYFLAIVHDISQLKDVTQTLSIADATFRSLLDAAPIGIGVFRDGTLEVANRGLGNLVGCLHDELSGRKMQTLFASDEAYQKAYSRAEALLLENAPCRFETKHLRRDGAEVDVFVTCATIVPGNLEQGIVFTALDITEQKAVQAQLRNKAEELSDANTALKVLLEHKDKEREAYEEEIQDRIDLVVRPQLELLRSSAVSDHQRVIVESLSRTLHDMCGPLDGPGAHVLRNLTPMQAKIAELIKSGHSTKEIAELLHISEKAVSFHRGNLRRKFGLTGRKCSLREYLLGSKE